MSPELVKEQSFETIYKKLKDHSESKCNVVLERFKFNPIKQLPSQSAKKLMMKLKQQVAKCKFGDSADDVMRDQIVIGVKEEAVQKRLLSNPKLTLQKAVYILLVEEQVE